MKFKEWLNSNVFQMYHGGKKWPFIPKELISSKKGKYEGGVGIYLTNKYETARKYAKGNKVVQILDIDKNYTDIENVDLPLNDLLDFLNDQRLKNKKEIINRITNYALRTNKDYVPANVVNNLIVNFEAGSGEAGTNISKYFVSKGIDASYQNQGNNEKWLVVFNPNIIKNVKVVDPKMVPSIYPFELY